MVVDSAWFWLESFRWKSWDSTRFLMRACSSVEENGFARKSLAPSSSALNLVSSSARAVSKMIGIEAVPSRFRNSLQTSRPSISGIIMSSRMMSGRNCVAFSSAWVPSTASSTS